MDWLGELAALGSASSSGFDSSSDRWSDDVLAFWFEELESADWFKKSDETDTKIGTRFLKTYKYVSESSNEDLVSSGRQVLAAVIVLDQFPRNLFRGHAQSFATDAKALALANRAIEAGYDQKMTLNERVVLYLPFEHSEDLANQYRAVSLISALDNENFTQYAIAHRDVIERFGRFPHRNSILGRQSTPEELAYLAEPGSGF